MSSSNSSKVNSFISNMLEDYLSSEPQSEGVATLIPDSPYIIYDMDKTDPTAMASLHTPVDCLILPQTTYSRARASSTVLPPAMLVGIENWYKSPEAKLQPSVTLPLTPPSTPPESRPVLDRSQSASAVTKPLPPLPRSPAWPVLETPLTAAFQSSQQSYPYKYSLDSDCAFMLDNVKIETESIQRLPNIPGQSYFRLPSRMPIIQDRSKAEGQKQKAYSSEKIVVSAPRHTPENWNTITPRNSDERLFESHEMTAADRPLFDRSNSLDRVELRSTIFNKSFTAAYNGHNRTSSNSSNSKASTVLASTPSTTPKHSRTSSREDNQLLPVWTSSPQLIPSPEMAFLPPGATVNTRPRPRKYMHKASMTNLFSRSHARAASEPVPEQQNIPVIPVVTTSPRSARSTKHARSKSTDREESSGRKEKLMWLRRPFGMGSSMDALKTI